MKNVVEVVDKGELDKILSENHNVVIDFHALDWCVPCQKFAPHFDKAAEALTHIKFVAVDVDKAPWAMVEYGVRGVPTVIQVRGDEKRDIKARAVVPLIKELES